MNSRWLPVPGFPDYEVSEAGEVVSHKRRMPLILKPSYNTRGYPIVSLCDGVNRHTRTVARMVMLAFVGPRPEGLEIRHLNGNNKDSRLENLAYGTHSENVLDCVAHGTHHVARRTVCVAGHPLSGANLYLPPQGGRQCRECRARRSTEFYARVKQNRSLSKAAS